MGIRSRYGYPRCASTPYPHTPKTGGNALHKGDFAPKSMKAYDVSHQRTAFYIIA